MSLLCVGACATDELPPAVDPCTLAPLKTSGLSFIFIECGYQFTDITDTVEWAALIAADDAVAAPPGFWGSPLPAQTNFDISCGKKFQAQEGKQFVYTGSEINITDLSDQTFWKTIRDNNKSYRVLPVTCDGQFSIEDSYASAVTVLGESPGFEFSWIVPPDWVVVEGENNLMTWQTTLQIPAAGIVCRRYLPGVLNLFNLT